MKLFRCWSKYLLIVFIITLQSCAAQIFDIKSLNELPKNESIVFGKVEVIKYGEAIDWSEVKIFNSPGSFDVTVLPDNSSSPFIYKLKGDGTFYWHLPQGSYAIAGFLNTSSNFKTHGRIFTPFEAVSYTHLTLPTILLV